MSHRGAIAGGVAALVAGVAGVLALLFAGAAALAASAVSGVASGVTGSADRGTVAVPLLGVMTETGGDLLPGVPPGGYPATGFAYGQCTYWAARNHLVTWSGNAGEWAANAAAHGTRLAAAPSIGAIAVFRAGDGYDPLHGHVGIVTAVTPVSYTISEMNMLNPGSGAVDARTIAWPDTHIEAFIP